MEQESLYRKFIVDNTRNGKLNKTSNSIIGSNLLYEYITLNINNGIHYSDTVQTVMDELSLPKQFIQVRRYLRVKEYLNWEQYGYKHLITPTALYKTYMTDDTEGQLLDEVVRVLCPEGGSRVDYKLKLKDFMDFIIFTQLSGDHRRHGLAATKNCKQCQQIKRLLNVLESKVDGETLYNYLDVKLHTEERQLNYSNYIYHKLRQVVNGSTVLSEYMERMGLE